MRRLRTAVVALLVAAGSVLGLADLAGAQAGPIDAAKKICDAAVARFQRVAGKKAKNETRPSIWFLGESHYGEV